MIHKAALFQDGALFLDMTVQMLPLRHVVALHYLVRLIIRQIMLWHFLLRHSQG